MTDLQLSGTSIDARDMLSRSVGSLATGDAVALRNARGSEPGPCSFRGFRDARIY